MSFIKVSVSSPCLLRHIFPVLASENTQMPYHLSPGCLGSLLKRDWSLTSLQKYPCISSLLKLFDDSVSSRRAISSTTPGLHFNFNHYESQNLTLFSSVWKKNHLHREVTAFQTNSSILYTRVSFQYILLVFWGGCVFSFSPGKRCAGFQDTHDVRVPGLIHESCTDLCKICLIWMVSLANISFISIVWMEENSACT